MIAQYLLLEKDGDIRNEINSRWSSVKKLFNRVIFVPIIAEMETAWQSFKEEYAEKAFAEAIEYISDQWIVDGIKQRFLRCYTN
jgi:ribosome-binding ATPase YchF (GTP1/OBG family)